VQLSGNAARHRDELMSLLEKSGIEIRPVVTGNLARQPAARLLGDIDPTDYPGAEEIHHHGFYLGLNPMFDDVLFEHMISTLDKSLNQVVTSTVRKAG
jgi:CDP-6-deoxy-D-xylo-4-hexulose-3-dehydrase